mmetsp:Transcript_16974/g.47392  ORF Transcript_16974/g.47392 Transcript_16974/m.47392 type:complete len:286 (+) Transcript_16974:374-1231(+)
MGRRIGNRSTGRVGEAQQPGCGLKKAANEDGRGVTEGDGCLKGILVRNGQYRRRGDKAARVRFAEPLVDAEWNPPRRSEGEEALTDEELSRRSRNDDGGTFIVEASNVKLSLPYSSKEPSHTRYSSSGPKAKHGSRDGGQKGRVASDGALFSSCIVDLTSPRQAPSLLCNNMSATYNPVYGDVLLVAGHPLDLDPLGKQGMHTMHQDEYVGNREQSLLCGVGLAWLLFAAGWLVFPLWYLGAFATCICRDRREIFGAIACSVGAVVATVVIVLVALDANHGGLMG